MDGYLSISQNGINEIVIERSRFITSCAPVKTEGEAREFLSAIRKKYSDATHNCYAYVTDNGLTTRSSDDGEPSGTAGAPIMEVLKGKKLINVIVVVTRYFGGIKLGTGGLVRAYSKSAQDCLSLVGVKEFFACNLIKIKLDYPEVPLFTREILPLSYVTVDTVYSEAVEITLAVKKSGYKAFIDKFSSIFYNREPESTGEIFM